MTASAQQDTTVFPVGSYAGDTVHSTANFTVKYVVSSFTGGFEKVDASLEVGDDGQVKLVGKVDANSVVVKDENLTAHLKGPDFFDTEKYPELTFESTDVTRDGDQVKVVGDLTIKGNTQRVEGTGTATPGTIAVRSGMASITTITDAHAPWRSAAERTRST